jgi:integrase
MAPDLASRAPAGALAAVLEAIAAVSDLTPQRRQNMASAVRTVARLLGRPPESVPADPRQLSRRLDEIAPEAAGITKERWNNVRSLLRAALALTRPMLPGRQLQTLSPSWQALYDRLPARQRRMRLSRLLRYFSVRGIEPEMVTQAHGDAFVRALEEETLLKDPAATWRDIVWAWNHSQAEVPGWPNVTLSFESRRRTYSQPWTSFPPSFKADVDAYLDRLSGCDLADETPFRPVRPATRQLRERQLRTFASALVQRGRAPSTICTLADLVAPDAFKDALRFFLDRRGGKSSRGIEELASTLRLVAKHWVRVDPTALDAMRAIVRKLSVQHRGMTEKNRQRLRPLGDAETRHALVNLPPRLMLLAESGKLRPRRAALMAQTAVLIEILIMAPMRMRNLVNLNLDRHLVRPARTRGALHIVIPGEEVKNGSELDYPLPEQSASLIGRYLECHRPLLASLENKALFPGPRGGAKSERTLALQITKTVFRFVGIKVNPHLFRHIAAKVHLDLHPGEYAVVARVLGNRSIDVTAAHYTGLETTAAVRHFDETILSLRRDPKP